MENKPSPVCIKGLKRPRQRRDVLLFCEGNFCLDLVPEDDGGVHIEPDMDAAPQFAQLRRPILQSSSLMLGHTGKHGGLRDAIDRLQNARNDLVGITFGVRAAVFQIALVTVLDEVNRHPELRRHEFGETIAELVNGLRFRADLSSGRWLSGPYTAMCSATLSENALHERFKIFLATYFADVFSREVAVHARSIPVTLDGFAVQYNVHLVFLTQTHHQIASGSRCHQRLWQSLWRRSGIPTDL